MTDCDGRIWCLNDGTIAVYIEYTTIIKYKNKIWISGVFSSPT